LKVQAEAKIRRIGDRRKSGWATARRLDEILDLFCQPLGCDQYVAAQHQLSHFVPIHFAHIQPECNPTPRSDVSGKIESLGLGRSKRLIIARQYFARDCYDTIPVMVIKEVSERLLSDQKLRVRSEYPSCHLRERKGNLSQTGEARVFRRIFHTRVLANRISKFQFLNSRLESGNRIPHKITRGRAYPIRSAFSGEMDAARIAGITAASKEQMASALAATVNAGGSQEDTP